MGIEIVNTDSIWFVGPTQQVEAACFCTGVVHDQLTTGHGFRVLPLFLFTRFIYTDLQFCVSPIGSHVFTLRAGRDDQ